MSEEQKREWEQLKKLYKYTRGYKSGVHLGDLHRRLGKPLDTLGDSFANDGAMSSAFLEWVVFPFPGSRSAMAPVRAAMTFTDLAEVAWATGSYMGVPAENKQEAAYDLAVMLTMWCETVHYASIQGLARRLLTDFAGDTSYGKSVLLYLARIGAVRLSKQQLGNTLGTLTGLALVEGVITPIINELHGLMLDGDDVFDPEDLTDGLVPVIGRLRERNRNLRRITRMRQVAEAYYGKKQQVLTQAAGG